jgi:hypothetical protein
MYSGTSNVHMQSYGKIDGLLHRLRSISDFILEFQRVATICTCLFGGSAGSAPIAGNCFAPLAISWDVVSAV